MRVAEIQGKTYNLRYFYGHVWRNCAGRPSCRHCPPPPNRFYKLTPLCCSFFCCVIKHQFLSCFLSYSISPCLQLSHAFSARADPNSDQDASTKLTLVFSDSDARLCAAGGAAGTAGQSATLRLCVPAVGPLRPLWSLRPVGILRSRQLGRQRRRRRGRRRTALPRVLPAESAVLLAWSVTIPARPICLLAEPVTIPAKASHHSRRPSHHSHRPSRPSRKVSRHSRKASRHSRRASRHSRRANHRSRPPHLPSHPLPPSKLLPPRSPHLPRPSRSLSTSSRRLSISSRSRLPPAAPVLDRLRKPRRIQRNTTR